MTEPIVFISNPRTGSYSICGDLKIFHSHEPWYEREPGEYTFATVRSPWHQARSWYVLSNLARYISFEDWCVQGCPVKGTWATTTAFAYRLGKDSIPWWAKCPPTEQLARIGHICDDIFRLEDVESWWPKLCSKPLRHLGKTTSALPPFTEIAIDAIALQQAELIERFGYESPKYPCAADCDCKR